MTPPKNTQECCVNCRNSLADNFCMVDTCTCHSPSTEDWEDEFAREFKEATEEFGLPNVQAIRSRLESYIRSLIENLNEAWSISEKQGCKHGEEYATTWREIEEKTSSSLKEELIEKLEGMKKECHIMRGDESQCADCGTYNLALSDAIAIIKEI